MTFPEFAKVMEAWGYAIQPDHYEDFRTYAQGMFNRRRAIIIKNKKSIEAILFYFLTFDYQTLYKKGTWEIPADNPRGDQLYIDKLVCRHWTRELRSAIKEALETKFPWVLEAVYHRAPFDRCVKIMSEYGKKEALFYSKV